MKKRIGPFMIVAYFGFFILVVLAMGFYWHQYRKPPTQPIKFPHYIHVGKLGLACTYCHQYVEQSPNAGIPSVQLCMDCHKNAVTDRQEIQKLTQYWEKGKPIPWIKVHHLPDYVYFTHKRHIKAGIECSQCHGPIQTYAGMRRVHSLKMGWCVTCHKQNMAPTDCTICHQ